VTTYPIIESELDPVDASYRCVVAAGEPWIHELREGEILRIVDLEGNQTTDTLFFNARDYGDRYSAQDTIRSQKNVYLTAGARLISSANHVLVTIVADTFGRHDTLGGACATETNMVLYSLEKRHMHACRQNFLGAMLEWGQGLDKRDISSNIGFFRNVPISSDGRLALTDGISEPGRYVEMRAEMDVLVVLSNCPQLNNPSNERNPSPIEILIWNAPKAYS
jgi:uncharacterized protein